MGKIENIYGLVGKKLGHSFSQKFFTEFFAENNLEDSSYQNFELENAAEIVELIANNPDIRGLNVTIPYKTDVIKFLDKIDSDAEKIGAVNTIKISSGMLHGFNTDHLGFANSLKPLLSNHHKKALILGDGGASKAVEFALQNSNISTLTVSRNPDLSQISYGDIDQAIFENYSIIINCTPVGTFPNVAECPTIPYQYFTKDHIAYDLIYNPAQTLFLKNAFAKGATIKNGLEMLEIQAMESWKIWNSAV